MDILNAGIRLLGGLLGVLALGAVLAVVAVPSGPRRDIFAVPGDRGPGAPASKQTVPQGTRGGNTTPGFETLRATGHGRIIDRIEEEARQRARSSRSDSANPGGK